VEKNDVIFQALRVVMRVGRLMLIGLSNIYVRRQDQTLVTASFSRGFACQITIFDLGNAAQGKALQIATALYNLNLGNVLHN
jgi:hypothetical protein